jgi:PAS domain S-box-containing protein
MPDKKKRRPPRPAADESASENVRLKADLEREKKAGLRFRLAAESATNLIYEWDLDSSSLEWLGHVDELLGYQPNELPRTWEGYTSLLHDEDRARVLAAVEKQLKSEEPYSVQCRVRRKDGTYLYWQDRGSVVRDASGKPLKWIGAVTDITERKKTEDALAVSEEKFRKAFYTSPDSVNINRLSDGLYVSINAGFTKIMGYTEKEAVGRTSVELNIWDDPEDRRRLVEGLRKDGMVENLEARFRAKDGAIKYGLMSAAIIEIDGQAHILNITRDISERKQAEKLRDALFRIANVANSAVTLDELFRSIHEAIGDLLPADNFYIALYDPDRKEISFPYFVDPYDEPPPPQKEGRGLTEYVLRTGAPLLAPPEVFDDLAREGYVDLVGEKSVDWMGVPLRIGERTIGVMVVQSYTESVRFGSRELEFLAFVSAQVAMSIERKKTEEALRALSLRQDAILTAVPNIIMEVDNDKVYAWANRAGLEFFGDDVVGREAAFYFEGEQETYGAVQPLFAGDEGTIYVESWQRRRDGQRRLLAWWCRGLKDEKGRVSGALSAALDITEHKRDEEKIRLSLKEKEVLLREIHHRVKNNMQVISSMFNLQAGHTQNRECISILKEAQTRIRSMSLVHEKLYRSSSLSRINFGDYLHSLASHLVQAYRSEGGLVRLETDFEDLTLDITSAMPCGLLLNELISNALKHAFPENREGMIRLGLKRGPEGLIEIRVADDGIGFPKGLDFTKVESFGFQIVMLLVRQLDAKIELDRTAGTAFSVLFRELNYPSRA